jgi:hypothetical protein
MLEQNTLRKRIGGIPLIYVNRRTFRQQMKAKLSSKQLQTQRNQKIGIF